MSDRLLLTPHFLSHLNRAKSAEAKKKRFHLWSFCGVTETELKRRPCLCPAVIIASSLYLKLYSLWWFLWGFLCCVHMVNCFKVLQIHFSAKCELILDLTVSSTFLTLLNSFFLPFCFTGSGFKCFISSLWFPLCSVFILHTISLSSDSFPGFASLPLSPPLVLSTLFYWTLCPVPYPFFTFAAPFFFLQCLAGLLSFPRSLSAFTHLFWL